MAEAAGIAFAVISLLIQALDNYEECASISKAWFGYEREFKRVTRRIKRFDLQYRYLLKRLLLPVLGEAEWQNIVSDPWRPDWKEIGYRLSQRLPEEEYNTYLETMEDLSSTMQRLQRKLLSLDNTGVDQQVGSMQIPQSKVKRFTFAFGERSRGRVLSEIEDLLGSLRFLIDGHENITRSAWPKGSPTTGLSIAEHQFWRCAHLFHSAVVSALSCSCSPSYNADLDLTYNDRVNVQPRVLLHAARSLQISGDEHRSWNSLTMTVSHAELPEHSPVPANSQHKASQHQGNAHSRRPRLLSFGRKTKTKAMP